VGIKISGALQPQSRAAQFVRPERRQSCIRADSLPRYR
jgi:hypothetical protein